MLRGSLGRRGSDWEGSRMRAESCRAWELDWEGRAWCGDVGWTVLIFFQDDRKQEVFGSSPPGKDSRAVLKKDQDDPTRVPTPGTTLRVQFPRLARLDSHPTPIQSEPLLPRLPRNFLIAFLAHSR